MNQSSETNRPAAITFICSVAFVWASLSVPLIFFSISKEVGSWYPLYLAFSVIVSYLGIGGIWLLKKWGLYVYIVFSVLHQVVLISVQSWTLFSVMIPVIVIGVTYTQRKSLQ